MKKDTRKDPTLPPPDPEPEPEPRPPTPEPDIPDLGPDVIVPPLEPSTPG